MQLIKSKFFSVDSGSLREYNFLSVLIRVYDLFKAMAQK